MNFVPKGPLNNESALVQVMAPGRRQAFTWTNAGPVKLRMYAALRGNELNIGATENIVSGDDFVLNILSLTICHRIAIEEM